jgi:hypothetical protein
MMFKSRQEWITSAALVAFAIGLAGSAQASSHMDAPLITLDDAANTTDVYAFVSESGGQDYLTTALAVYPFEEPGIGPNNYRFDDNVLYEIHIATGRDVERGRATYSYRFEFETVFQDRNTILQAFLATGPVGVVDGAFTNLNLMQSYKVTRVDHRRHRTTLLGSGLVPPNNQGNLTPLYNQGNDGENAARDGVSQDGDLDDYTKAAIAELKWGHIAFAGQRDDGFYADIQAIFDGLSLRSGEGNSFDSQGGFNLHTIALNIPLSEIGGELQQVGVYATTSRRAISVVTPKGDLGLGKWVQVGRQGNPLFCEGFVAIADKDLYNRTSPVVDRQLFAQYAEEPELARLVNLVFGPGALGFEVIEEDRSDLAGIFIPDLIKVDLSTGPARLAGTATGNPDNPNDEGFSRLGVFGADVLQSQIQAGLFGDGSVPGGWPNGRRFGDDVTDIAISALFSDLRSPDPAGLVIRVADGIDNVNENDIGFNKVFPYAATPLNGRNHGHH